MSNPKISVIVPVYNLEKYIENTVNCLVNQTYDNLEIILVDDGSTDKSPQILDSLADKYNNLVVIHQQNAGVSTARNKGINAATGEYIGFCDGDDAVDNDIYQFLYELMIRDKADISICEVRFVLPGDVVKEIATGEHIVWDNVQDYLVRFLNGSTKMGVYTKLFKADICKSIQFPVDLKINEDKYYCFLAALKANRITSHNVAKYSYYRRPGSSSITAFNKKYFDYIKVSDMMLKDIEDNYPELLPNAKAHKLASTLRLYKEMYQKDGLKEFSAEAQELIKYVKTFDKSIAKKYLLRNNYIRFMLLRSSRPLFFFVTKFFDKF